MLDEITRALTLAIAQTQANISLYRQLGRHVGAGVLVTIEYPTITVGLDATVPVDEVRTVTKAAS